MKKIYISGKISGLDFGEVAERFEKIEKDFQKRGFVVVNPTKNGLPKNSSWAEHMRRDL